MRSVGLIAVLLALALAATVSAGTSPLLRVSAMAPFTVRGTAFRSGERVTVRLNRVWVKRTRAGVAGAFTARFPGLTVSRCDGYRVTATGSKGSHAILQVHGLACAGTNPG